jgi:hypothetical protein
MVETADGVELDGVDFTKAPGVEGAEIKTFAWVTDGQQETTERVLITESVEGTVTVTENAEGQEGTPAPAGPPEGVLEAVRAALGVGTHHALGNGICSTCKPVSEAKDPKKPYGDVTYADPGYQSDGKKRYPLDSSDHVRSAWSYINQAKNAAKYSSAQLKRIKGRIKAAMSRIGAKVSTETAGWVLSEPFQVTEAVAEWYGDPGSRGSWCISASNGPVSMSLSSYSMDPADLDVILRAAADAACQALAALDPDMDGDVDVPGAGDNSDTDGDAGRESAEDPELTEATGPGQPAGARETTNGTEAPVTTEATTTPGGSAPSASTPAPAAAETAPAPAAAAEDADARTARIVAEALKAAGVTPPAPPVEETEEQRVARLVAEALKAQGTPPAPPAGAAETTKGSGEDTVTETDEQRVERMVNERLAAAGLTPAGEVQETDEQRVERLVTERLQGLVADGSIAVQRTGLVREHKVPTGEAGDPGKTADELAKTSEDDFYDYAGAALVKNAGHTRAFGGATQ